MSNKLLEKLPLYLKWRPLSIDGGTKVHDLGIVLKPELKDKIREWKSDSNVPHLLMIGKSGIGKTTLARIVANEILGCEEILDMNASKETGIDYIRDRVVEFCSGQSYNGGLKTVIVGEADGLTMQAQDCLNEVIETYASNTRFIFTANKSSKLSKAIFSRCTEFNIEYSVLDYQKRCALILKKEGIDVDLKLLKSITQKTYPDFRQGLEQLKLNTVGGSLKEIQSVNKDFLKDLWLMIFKKEDPMDIRRYYIENYESFSGDYYGLLQDLISMAIDTGIKLKDSKKMDMYNEVLWFIARANRAIRDESLHRDAELNTFQVMIENKFKDYVI